MIALEFFEREADFVQKWQGYAFKGFMSLFTRLQIMPTVIQAGTVRRDSHAADYPGASPDWRSLPAFDIVI